ncbi:MAG: calcium-binding protein [Solirubrobacteraceae bacterium]
MIRSANVTADAAPSRRRGRPVLVAAAALATLVIAPGSAEAAQVTLSGGTLTYQAAPGETNTPAFGSFASGFYVNDAAATLTVSGTGCSRSDLHTISCPDTAVTRLVVNADDGNDSVDLSLNWRGLPSQLNGGAGNDTIKGGPGIDAINGGSGDDTIRGNGGADSMSGGDGIDTVTYAGRSAGVSASLDGIANDGSAAEGDNVATDVENLIGTDLGDTLTGDGAGNVLTGGPGGDHLDGAGGSDTLSGGDGDDVIASRDALVDQIACGLGVDVVTADRVDVAASDCESVELPSIPVVTPPPGQLPPLLDVPTIVLPTKPIAVSSAGDVPLPVTCPAKATAACAGYVTLTLAPSALARISRRGGCLTRSCKRPPRPRGGRVGSRHFIVQIGHIVSLRVGLNSYAQWKLHHDGHLRVRVNSYSKRAGRTTQTGSSVTTLLRPRASHRRGPRR